MSVMSMTPHEIDSFAESVAVRIARLLASRVDTNLRRALMLTGE